MWDETRLSLLHKNWPAREALRELTPDEAKKPVREERSEGLHARSAMAMVLELS